MHTDTIQSHSSVAKGTALVVPIATVNSDGWMVDDCRVEGNYPLLVTWSIKRNRYDTTCTFTVCPAQLNSVAVVLNIIFLSHRTRE